MEWIKLIGIVIIVLGFIFKLDTIAVVVIAGFATALVSGITPVEFLEALGQAFVNQRIVTIFFLTLPLIGLAEKNGLKEQAVNLIKKVKGMTSGTFLSIYLIIREIAGMFSIRLGGHPQFVRPLVQPMAEAAAEAKHGELDAADKETIKAKSAAMENYGNFFGQNTFLGAAGVLLIVGTLDSLGYKVSGIAIAKASLPIAMIMLIIGVTSNILFDRKLKKKYQNKGEGK
ncbi:DUF969 domain-containing protein [Vagococcus lutrae]|uniref:DUF969 domain-containing protein n=1 Tax=Vagococcus lutrae TaxID=81947 RepID=A0AAF0BFI4_9ENTE|nr:DUF969 domain-containing protein [Vagococcus lutrae]MDO5742574.1 DUF969 domain-containing protein [Vagococcus sp.]MCO7151434.1 DUF969 domain-containing protein [Vagococcus lutrae]MDT2806766.1 DUF969 domain-containing protein [Vagococcus lutrae]MDT2817495.1 DUF969 domain-containing protein [Vagococcus lutrae]MDT2819453.1 DUF969 domain-containing protein [Vagococcus lutrae]